MANTAWAFAKLEMSDAMLTQPLGGRLGAVERELNAQNLANTV